MKRNALLALGAIVMLLALLPAGAAANVVPIGSSDGAQTDGGNTSASSGNASANGGNAQAYGGNANVGNAALVGQSNSGSGSSNSGTGQENSSDISQGDNTVHGGNPSATGGEGGIANSGNEQFGNGNAVVLSTGNNGAKAEGGDTSAKSGNASANGGNAQSSGGNASVDNTAASKQSNQSDNANGCTCSDNKPGKFSGTQGKSGSGQDNHSDIDQGGNTVHGGNPSATGGDGGFANSGNTQILNGNAVAVTIGGESTYGNLNGNKFGDQGGSGTEAKGGNTYAQSGKASANGGNAQADGGNAGVWNNAVNNQQNDSQGSNSCPCGSQDNGKGGKPELKPNGGGSGSEQENSSDISQGDNTVHGGNPSATGGEGGFANSGNEQFGNGNALALSIGGPDSYPGMGKSKDGSAKNGSGSEVEGGNTSAKSGNASANGGNAQADGGNAGVWNNAVNNQQNDSQGSNSCPCGSQDNWSKDGNSGFKPNGGGSGSNQENSSDIDQGDNTVHGGNPKATGGEGGFANSGNEQEFNGNAITFGGSKDHGVSCDSKCFSSGGGGRGSETSTEGGNTYAQSGKASANGGNAQADGGNAGVWNNAVNNQQNDSQGSNSCPCGSQDNGKGGKPELKPNGGGSGSEQENSSDISQGDNTVHGGNPSATGGEGGFANSGNEQEFNGNAGSSGGSGPTTKWFSPNGGGSGSEVEGGNTSAKSGNASANGGNAQADGGNAGVWNNAVNNQQNDSQGSNSCPCGSQDNWSKDGNSGFKPNGGGSGSNQENSSDIDQGDNTVHGGNPKATGGEGGFANSGNEQEFNGNALVLDFGKKVLA